LDRFDPVEAADNQTSTCVSSTFACNSGLNVSKAAVEAAQKAGKALFSNQEILASDAFVQSIVASSNYYASVSVSGLTKGWGFSPNPYWQSAGPSGSHHLTIELKPGFIARTVGIVVDPLDGSYCPSELTVSVARSSEALNASPVHPVAHNFSHIALHGQRFLFALLDNEDPCVKFIRIGIHRCVSSGQEARVRGIIVRATSAAISLPSSSTSSAPNSFRSLDSSFIWIQSITDGIVHDMKQEAVCDFSECEQGKDIAAKIHKVFVRVTRMICKYIGPVSVQEHKNVRNVRYACCRNAMLRIIPEALHHFWHSHCDISSCLDAAATNLCAAAMQCSIENTADDHCKQSFESLILLSDIVAPAFSFDDIRSTILNAIKRFVGDKLINSALLQHALRTSASSLWGQTGTPETIDSSLIWDQRSVQVPPGKYPVLHRWRGPLSGNRIVGEKSTQVKFFDFSTLRGPAFHRREHRAYYEIQVKVEGSGSQFGFITPEFQQDFSETAKGCGDDSQSWYVFQLHPFFF
jgi:hypothetical protein